MKNRTMKMISLILAVMLLVSMTACGSGKSNSSNARTDIVIGKAAEPPTLDPHKSGAADINENMALCLTHMTGDLKVEGEIAKNWTINADETEYVFEIDTSIKFANGDNITVNDVKFSLDRAMAEVGNTQYFACVESFEIVDDTHIKATLLYPCALFLKYMADSATTIVCQKVVEAAGEDYGINPAGSCAGPYDFVSWEKGVCIKLKANPYYAKELKIKDVEFRFISEANTGAISVEAGDIDVYENPNYIDVVNMRKSDKVSIFEQSVCGFDFLGFNVMNPPYDNVLVRQAIAYSFDKAELVQAAIGEGGATPATGFFPDFVFGHSDEVLGYEHDPAKAKELLKQAGYPDGLEISIITMDGSRNKVAEYLQDAMKESGFTVKIELVEWSKFIDDLINGNLGAFIIGVAGDVPDADSVLYPQFRSDGGQNVHNYANARVDELLMNARLTSDDALRLQYYVEAQNIMMEELPCIPLFFKTNFMLYNSGLKNFTSNFSTDVLVEYLSWE